MMDIINLMINQGFSLRQLLKIILYMLPQIILLSLPTACLMSVMLAFIRLGHDNEIIALNASGISLYQMLPAVIFFSLVSCLLAGVMSIYGVPWGNKSDQDYVLGIMQSKTNIPIKERIFYEPFDKVTFYVNSYSTKEKEMKDIFLVDRRDDKETHTIVAEKGTIVTGVIPNTITLYLNNGTIFINQRDYKKASYSTFRTTTYPINLGDIAAKIASREKKPKEMTIGELIRGIKTETKNKSKKNEMGIQLYEMFSIPLAIFILGTIGAYLGSHVKARGRTAGVIISLFVFIIYYVSLMGSEYICKMGLIPPYIGVWLPVFFMSVISMFLFSRVKWTGSFSLFQ
jgi:lipopolysaccharide export system permease protein